MPNGLRTRENVAGMGTNHPTLVAYRAAVNQMKNLPRSDPRNWVRQAQIHRDNCPHGNLVLPAMAPEVRVGLRANLPQFVGQSELCASLLELATESQDSRSVLAGHTAGYNQGSWPGRQDPWPLRKGSRSSTMS